MVYAIAGVSGNTGKVAAETLLAQGKKVRVIVRDAKKGEPWAKKGAEVAVADLADAPALQKAFTGATGAYLLVPPDMAAPKLRDHQRKVLHSIVEAVKGAKLPHLVLLSSVGAHLSERTGPILGLHWAEQELSSIPGLATTFIRAPYFMENVAGSLAALPHGLLPTFLDENKPVEMIATKDIGAVAAKHLVEGGKGKTVIELSGPKTYTNVEIAQVVSGLVGKEIKSQQGPIDAVVPTFKGFGMTDDLAEHYKEMIQGMNDGRIAFEGGSALRVRGSTSIEDVLGPILKKGA